MLKMFTFLKIFKFTSSFIYICIITNLYFFAIFPFVNHSVYILRVEWIIDVDLLEADCHLFKNFDFKLIHFCFFCKVLVVFFPSFSLFFYLCVCAKL